MRSKDTESVNTADHTQHMLQGMEQVQNGKKISRRALMASLGMAGVAVASGGLVQTINAAGNPHDKIGELSDLQTTDKSNLVSAINENVADNASRVYNVKYPPAPLVAAVGDGVADDTTAIQAVINAANAAGSPGGAIVFFPPNSKYKVTSTLTVKAGVILRGGSRRSTIIKSYITDGSALFELPLPSPNTAGSTYFTYHMEDMRIEGYGTDGLGTGCGNAIHIADANKVHLSRLDVVNFPDATGIYYRSGAFHSLISECEVTGCDVGIDINGNTGNPNKVTMIHVVDSVFNGKTAAVNVYQSVQVSFQRCTIQDATDTSGTDTGIGALVQESEQINLKDCWFERTVHDSLKIRNSNAVIIEDCHFSSAGYTGGAQGTENVGYYYVNAVGATTVNVMLIRPFFYAKAGSEINFAAGVTNSMVYLPIKRNGAAISVINGGTTNYVFKQDTSGLTYNARFQANEFRASSTNGYSLAGGDGSDYNIRVDANKKSYVRRSSDGIVRATGDIHYGGSTASRPASPLTYESYYDTTLGKPIWWNGTNWKDATGVTV